MPRNLAAIMRSCDAVGVLAAHAVWPGGRLKISRPASGGNRKWLPVHKHKTLAEALERVKGAGLRVLAAHPRPGAVPFREVDYTLPTCLLLGNEDNGITPEALSQADGVVAIPMEGMGTSLNVSVAAALLLFEAQRQRRAAGLYDAPRLDPETHARMLFEWVYPRSRPGAGSAGRGIRRWGWMGRFWGRCLGRPPGRQRPGYAGNEKRLKPAQNTLGSLEPASAGFSFET